jgi:hypothetical protein
LSNNKSDIIERAVLTTVLREKPQTTAQLAHLVSQRFHIPESDVLSHILTMQGEGRLQLTRDALPVPANLRAYLKTERALWYWLTVALTITTATMVFLIPDDLLPWVYARYLLGAVFLLWLPGYTFIKALFPGAPSIESSKKTFRTVERMVLGFGMSLVLVPIGGLVLYYTPWGIRPTSILLSLLAAALVLATIALIREFRVERSHNRGER